MPKNVRIRTGKKRSAISSRGWFGLGWAAILSIGWMVLFLGMVFARMEWAKGIDRSIYDMACRFSGEIGKGPDIVLVQIDDESIEKIGRWPWPRSIIAKGIDKIRNGNPRAIGLNLILSEPEDHTAVDEIGRLASLFQKSLLESSGETGAIFYRELTQSAYRLDNDRLLADAVSQAKNVILPVYVKEGLVPRPSDPQLLDRVSRKSIRLISAASGLSQIHYRANQIVLPVLVLLDAARSIGHVNLRYDADGKIRREPLFYETQGMFIPAYPLAMAAACLGIPVEGIRIDTGEAIVLGDLHVPISLEGEMLLRFRPADSPFSSVSFVDVLNDKVSMGMFQNRLVIVGASAAGIMPAINTPVMASMSAGEFMASGVSTILNRHFYREPGWGVALEIALILLIGVLGMTLAKVRASIAVMAFWLGSAALITGSVLMISGYGIWISIGFPLVQWMLTTIGILGLQYVQTQSGLDKSSAQSAESHRMLGLSFQGQGLLDMAFEKFRKVPVDADMKEILYTLSLDFERKRQFNKAAAVLEYIASHDPAYRDVASKQRKLVHLSETIIFGDGSNISADVARSIDAGDEDIRPTLGRYEVIRQLGKGAMGVVYLGMDPRIRRMTAIKTFHFPYDADPTVIEKQKTQFFREAESAGTLSHPNIVTIYDAGEEQDLAYIAMEFLEGSSLEAYTLSGQLPPIRTVVGYGADVADALAYAHQRGVVHRDIKPANIMLLKTGEIKVTDFGIARITAASQTQTGVVKGTPSYMSPEQFSGKKVDGRSDIFSLGVTLFQLLTGQLPFTGENLPELMHRIMMEPHPDPKAIRPEIPKPLVQILNKALEKDVEKRYQQAAQMAEHLRKLAMLMDAAAKTATG